MPVVIHDLTLRRTAGRVESVSALTSAELRELDVGGWFNRRHAAAGRPEYARERIPTLNQVFSLIKHQRKRRVTVYVEMKTAGNSELNLDLARAVVASIQRFEFHDRAIVISFNLPTVAAVTDLDCGIRTGALFGRRESMMMSSTAMIARAQDYQAKEIALHHSVVTRRSINLALKNKLSVVVWTTEDPEWLSRAREMGISAVMTNDPARMIGLNQSGS